MWRTCTRARYGNNPDMETVPDGTQRHCKILTLPLNRSGVPTCAQAFGRVAGASVYRFWAAVC